MSSDIDREPVTLLMPDQDLTHHASGDDTQGVTACRPPQHHLRRRAPHGAVGPETEGPSAMASVVLRAHRRDMTAQIVVLGGGTGGTLLANRLDRALPAGEARVTVVDRDDAHVYQPGLLFLPFGGDPKRMVRSRSGQLRRGVEWRQATVDQVDLDSRRVLFDDGSSLGYDVLIVATGAR